ncbi:MAG TPA: metal/formaldehyde-sensitive transcriptional repressor [Thermoanaerobaculia bacterium]|nr:metal/formaldehyde-sensitive transcriptional repressor [Thermoanaerobaculia bacterium]
MSHVIRNKTKLVQRVARIRGQLDAVARALDEGIECGEVLRVIASARGAMNGLMAEVLEDHIRAHVFGGEVAGSSGSQAAEELIDVVRSYLK